MSKIILQNGDCLELLKGLDDNSIDIIFCDPPYALGSEVIIKPDGKPEYKKAVDFMSKWEQPNGTFWEEWFIEAKRVLKYGGHCLMFGMDRQLWFNCYYANLSGFTQKQSLYWYFISNFPKASDLSKNLDKYFGAEREVTKEVFRGENAGKQSGIMGKTVSRTDITSLANTPLAKKYEGIKYSVAPLKQTNETIMVFQKPYKTGSCLHDVLALENGDETITCGGVDIEGNRCATEENLNGGAYTGQGLLKTEHFSGLKKRDGQFIQPTGRFPAQTYIDSGASEIIDLQSGLSKGNFAITKQTENIKNVYGKGYKRIEGELKSFGDSVGASRILHRCDFEAGDFDLYNYCPKVSKSERNEGLEGFEEKNIATLAGADNLKKDNQLDDVSKRFRSFPVANSHPTVKPKALLSKILKLFKTPNDQVLLDPFMGSGSMGISAVETGFDYIGFELDQDYFQIAKARIEHAKNNLDGLFPPS